MRSIATEKNKVLIFFVLMGLLLFSERGNTMPRPEPNKLGRDQMLERAFDEDTGFLYVVLTNSIGNSSIIDNVSNSLTAIDFWSHKIHEGEFFNVDAVDLSMSQGDTIILAFKTPAGNKHAHLVTDFITNGDAHMQIIQSPTWDQLTGTLSPIRNRLTSDSDVSSMEENQVQAPFTKDGNLILNPTNLAGGTILDTTYTFTEIPKGQGGNFSEREWILTANTQYAVVLTSDTNNNKGQLKLAWYEHVDAI